MYKLTITELAQNDLDEIVKYILAECSNKMAAVSFLDEVDKCYALLQNSPRIYSICLNKRLEKEGYRRAPIKNYLLIYKIDDATKSVIIMRFFYGAQDYLNLI